MTSSFAELALPAGRAVDGHLGPVGAFVLEGELCPPADALFARGTALGAGEFGHGLSVPQLRGQAASPPLGSGSPVRMFSVNGAVETERGALRELGSTSGRRSSGTKSRQWGHLEPRTRPPASSSAVNVLRQ